MTGALIIAVITVLAWFLLRWHDRIRRSGDDLPDPASPPEEENEGEQEEECCGAHSYCVKLLPRPEKAVYFNDEELDRFAGKLPSEYTPEETDEMREVMLTLLPREAPEWAQSLQMRGIEVPEDLIEELNLLITEELSRR